MQVPQALTQRLTHVTFDLLRDYGRFNENRRLVRVRGITRMPAIAPSSQRVFFPRPRWETGSDDEMM